MVILYGYYPSGNSYKIELLLTQLHIPYRFRHMNLAAGETRTPAFLAINPNGRIPVVEVAPGRHLAESHAILWYYGEDTAFMPTDRWQRAQLGHWLSFEQYHVEPNIGTPRYHLHSLKRTPAEIGPMLGEKQKGARDALALLETHLAERAFMLGERYSLADISLFAYSHVAPEAGIPLEPYPNLRAWMARVRAQPDHIPMSPAPPS